MPWDLTAITKEGQVTEWNWMWMWLFLHHGAGCLKAEWEQEVLSTFWISLIDF